jgi:hypothetical protein
MRRVLAVAVLGAGVVLAAWLLWPRPPDDDEALIRAAIAEMTRLASKKDIGGLGDHVSDGYHGEGGSKRDLKRYLLGYTMRSDWVSVLPAKVEVTLGPEPASAKVSMLILLARTPAERAEDLRAEQIAGSHQIEADFAKEDGEWRVFAARRRDARVSDLF